MPAHRPLANGEKPMSRTAQIKLAPSILTADFGHLARQVQEIESAGGVDWIHVDIMDGVFVPNISFGPIVVSAVRRATSLPLDLHLMIVDPGRHVAAFVDSGATSITVHVEACTHLNRDLAEIQRLGARAGVALNPGTSSTALDAVIGDVDLILVMTVNPGFGGQKLIPSTIGKVARVRAMLDLAQSAAELEVDGGISAANVSDLTQAGATVVVAGSAILQHPKGIAEGIAALRRGVMQL
jgi:ribulose-phosphate 3-epimerase